MKFIDILYGKISFEDAEERLLVEQLIATPEVQRLRFLRLLNHDVPFMQDLATARRFAHSIGACFAASRIIHNSPWVDQKTRREILSAALIHDIGILPYGHLIEREVSRIHQSFSHEVLVRGILSGTYHPTNVYHQILPNASLKIASVLDQFNVDQDKVYELIYPEKKHSPVAGPIDVDNIDNVHRMAALIGRVSARRNVSDILDSISLDQDLQMVFEPGALPLIRRWFVLRAMLYKHMIAHPDCVAYNAFLQDVAKSAVRDGIIGPDTWFLNEVDFEAKLLASKDLLPLVAQLRTGCRYRLMDYVYISDHHHSMIKKIAQLERVFMESFGSSPVQGSEHRLWIEVNKISRSLDLRIRGQSRSLCIGSDSAVLLFALIDTGTVTKRDFSDFQANGREQWRLKVEAHARELMPNAALTFCYPEFFPFGGSRQSEEQLELFSNSA